jgi:hypothetical protein
LRGKKARCPKCMTISIIPVRPYPFGQTILGSHASLTRGTV